MRVLYRLAGLVGAVALILFSVSNRETVSLEFWPVPFATDLPLYLIVLVALLAGFAIGEIAAWLGSCGRRRRARQDRRRLAALERELAATQSRLDRPVEPARG
jgi:lipopolysaccharide assembly protein A